MNMIAELMEHAVADTNVLRTLDRNGDRFSAFRKVDFLLRCPDAAKASLVASFINDHSYGSAVVQDSKDVLVAVQMPVEQSVLLCVSGFFVCLAQAFGIQYDGWGCVAQSQT